MNNVNSSSFLQPDGTLAPPRHAWWRNWLPTLAQVQQAAVLDFSRTPTDVWALSMRQGMGLVVVAALVAGFLPFLINTVVAMRVGAALPLVELAQQAQRSADTTPSQLGDAFQTVAGLDPAVLPGWLAALLSTIGAWINWPLRWLTIWLVYGTATLLAAKVWGAPTTLQRFFALTSYAAAPLILTTLGPIPCLGALAQVVGWLWATVVYVTSVRVATGLDWGRAAVAVLLPAAIFAVLGFIVLLATASTLLRMAF